ncbi:MAG: hypothetical protein DRP56_01420 [Planctomycetota bacterium]|nr:MAG: hypothetical protein DRP56_01420 [Planctomycetota bacterium]
MNTNKAKTAQTVQIKIEATLPLPLPQPKATAKGNCSGCGKCGQNGQCGGNTMRIAGETLLTTVNGDYSEAQVAGALDIIAAALRRHYGRE